MGFYINNKINIELTQADVHNLTMICNLYIKYRIDIIGNDPDDVVYVDITNFLSKLNTTNTNIELTWQEECAITMAYNYYIRTVDVDYDIKKELLKILNKIEKLLTNHPDDNIPNGH